MRRVSDTKKLPVRKLSLPGIPREVLAAVATEQAHSLGGVYGDPSWGEPIQFDRIVIEGCAQTTDIMVYNRGILLFATDSETIRRIHRLCETLREACNEPG